MSFLLDHNVWNKRCKIVDSCVLTFRLSEENRMVTNCGLKGIKIFPNLICA